MYRKQEDGADAAKCVASTPSILHKYLSKFSFRTVRIGYDLAFIVVGYLFGAPFAVVTIMMAFLLGPAIEWVGEKIKPLL